MSVRTLIRFSLRSHIYHNIIQARSEAYMFYSERTCYFCFKLCQPNNLLKAGNSFPQEQGTHKQKKKKQFKLPCLLHTELCPRKKSRINCIPNPRVSTHSYGKQSKPTEAKLASGSLLVQKVQGYLIKQCLPKHKSQELQSHALSI